MTSVNQQAERSDLGPFQALGRIVQAFYAPRRLAEAIRERPNWVFPLLFSMLLSFVVAAALIRRPEWQQTLQKAVESSGQKLGELEKVQLLHALRAVSWAFSEVAAPEVGVATPLKTGRKFPRTHRTPIHTPISPYWRARTLA